MNLDLQSFTCVQPNTGAAMTAVTGDPTAIRNGVRGKDIFCLAAWSTLQSVAGFTQILWPSGHDLVRGFRWQAPVALSQVGSPGLFPMCFKPQDPLTLTQSGSNTALDRQYASLLMWYEDLPGIDAHLITVGALHNRGVQSLTVQGSITATDTGTYSGEEALNADSDLLHADTLYAIVGGTVSVRCTSLAVRGPDFGNMRLGFPGEPTQQQQTAQFFADLGMRLDLPCIPVFNSANRAGTLVSVLQDENATAVPYTLNLVELGPARQSPTA
ncbi:MAG TPA: hypothetical protein VN418_07625 [Gammaproteobacteria bacterium]|nr:hypothetical protein [Gammaproteobacteria bacterium]